jgi:hypothetical protein
MRGRCLGNQPAVICAAMLADMLETIAVSARIIGWDCREEGNQITLPKTSKDNRDSHFVYSLSVYWRTLIDLAEVSGVNRCCPVVFI